MKDIELLKEILEKSQWNTTFYWTFGVFVALNLLATLFNIGLQVWQKKSERKDYRIQKREDRKIEVLESLYKSLEKLSYYGGQDNDPVFLDDISSLQSYIYQHRLYLNKKLLVISNEILDYYRNVYANHINKDIGKEEEFFSKFVIEFNK